MRYKKTVGEYFKEFSGIYLDNFEACVNVICDPSKYSNSQRLSDTIQVVKHPKVYSTIGCHPHFADMWNSDIESLIYSVLDNPRIVAIGECGLDDSRKNQVDIACQLKTFKAQLIMANETKKPIVIHCRDREEQVFKIMQEYLHSSHKIHLHCFTGGWKMGKIYLDYFPNLCIGVTPLITYKSNRQVRELVENIPIERLLLETDAPYFVPQTNEFPHGVEVCHPGFIFSTAEEVARLKDIPINTLLKSVRENVSKVYGF